MGAGLGGGGRNDVYDCPTLVFCCTLFKGPFFLVLTSALRILVALLAVVDLKVVVRCLTTGLTDASRAASKRLGC